MIAIVGERGQVTIPKPLRRRLGIAPKAKLDFRERNGKLIVVKAEDKDPVKEVMGCLNIGKTSDEIMSLLR